MDRYIQPGCSILDIGGGPGHYSIHYAKQGHPVTLLDLSDENVRFAKKKARQCGVKITALQGNALDLSRFPDESFDTVFLMGPLYHLMNEESILAPYKNELAKQPKKIRMAWYEYALRFCEKREYLTHTEHLMIVSKKDS